MNSPEHTDLYDLVIIGAGPAGMTAAVYAGRSAGFVISMTLADRTDHPGRELHGFRGDSRTAVDGEVS